MSYIDALALQTAVQTARRQKILADTLLLMEHSPVITLGRGSDTVHDLLSSREQLAERGIAVAEADRGGEITYHAPGQLVCYPILELSEARNERDLHRYLRRLEEVIIAVLRQLGLRGERLAGLTGVWVNGAKVAAIGIKVSRWVTMHGFALNIDIDLTPMRRDFVPCGIVDRGVTSLAELGLTVKRDTVEALVVPAFAAEFNRLPVEIPHSIISVLQAHVPVLC